MTNAQKRDVVVNFQGATIQHGPLSKRVYLMNLGEADPSSVIPSLTRLAEEKLYTKIFAKVPKSRSRLFYEAGFVEEARIPGFFNGRDDGVFLGLYLDDSRLLGVDRSSIDRIVAIAHLKRGERNPSIPPLDGLQIRACGPSDVEDMGRLYRDVFQSYPFPIQDPEYLLETMQSNVAYFCADEGGRIVALSSAEMDLSNRNAEMTDFATLPDFRGRRLATHLLAHMEGKMRDRGILAAYTISRAASAAVNITFASMGYAFSGVLPNNTNIAGRIESMTVWHKSLP